MSISKNFVVRHGFEASTNLIFADATTRRVGVGTTALQYTLHVNGGIGATDLYVSGVGTLSTLNANNAYIDNAFISSGVGTFSTLNAGNLFINSGVITSIVSTSGTITFLSGTSLNYSGISTLGILISNQITSQNLNISGISTLNNVFLDGYLSVGGTTGQQNQVLVSTGVGVTWKTSSNLRTSTSFTATPGQTSFSATYSIGFVDVYINGVKLTNTEFVATNGTSIVLNDSCFGSESIEIIAFEVEYPLTFSGITLQEEGSVVGTGIDAINFVGDAVTAISVGAGSTIFVNAQLPLTSSSNVVVGIITATSGFVGNINSSGVSTVTSLVATNINASGIITATSGFVGNINSSGVSTVTSLVATNINASGIITATNGFSGNLTGNVTGEVNAAAFDTNASGVVVTGVTTSTSGFVGNVGGDLAGNVFGNVTGNINSSGVSTVTSLVATNINASGIITATTFIGALTGTASTATLATSAQGLTGTPNITVGIITATGGFVSTANTTPVTIQLVGNQLTFNAVGIGSTTLTLF